MNIIDFLEARIDEDESRAGSGRTSLRDSRWETDNYGRNFLTPSAVLAECAAKRAIIDMHESYMSMTSEGVGISWIAARCAQAVTHAALQALASVYKDHPDYQQEWTL